MSNKIGNRVKMTVLNLLIGSASRLMTAKENDISPSPLDRIDETVNGTNEDVYTEPAMTKNVDGLYPCPFCGGDGRIRSERYPENHPIYNMSYYVECSECHLMTATIRTGKQPHKNRELSTAEAIERVTNMWNNRLDKERGADNND